MLKVHMYQIGEKIATFWNFASGETLEKPFHHANINTKIIPHQNLVDAGITNDSECIIFNP
jgi:hypothetical protein